MKAFFNTVAQQMFGPAAGFQFRIRKAGEVIGVKPSTRPHAVRPNYVAGNGEIELGFGLYQPGKGWGSVKVERAPVPSGVFELVKGKLGWYNAGLTPDAQSKALVIFARSADEFEALLSTLIAEDREVFDSLLIDARAQEAAEAAAKAAEAAKKAEELAAKEAAKTVVEATPEQAEATTETAADDEGEVPFDFSQPNAIAMAA
jgi:hypothetical protein